MHTQGHQIPVGLPGTCSTICASGDFETYSEAGFRLTADNKIKGNAADGKGGLPVVGTPVYAEHVSAEVLVFWYDLKDGKGRRPWFPCAPNPLDLFEHIAAGGLFEAWNVTFEFYIWNLVCVRKYGWPPLPLEQCRCVMARARRNSLPAGLDNAAKVLGTLQKNPEGERLIRKLTRPHTPTKNRPAIRWTPATAWPDFEAFYRYGEGDVGAEDAAATRIPDLTPAELASWQLDQRINARGVQVDVAALDAALGILRQTEDKYNAELQTITGGAVKGVGEIAKIQAWMAGRGYHIDNMQKPTVDEAVRAGDAPPDCQRVLEIRQELGAANVKKLRTLKLQVSSDGRLRDQYKWCGADRTGRASAGGVQLQNITAKGPKSQLCCACERYSGQGARCPRCRSDDVAACVDWTVDAVDDAIKDIITGSLDHVERVWGSSITVLCGILRGLFIAREGHKLVCVDYSAVEAVVAACLSRCQWRIEVFSTHGKIYEASAAKATGIPFETILAHKKEHGTHHPARKGVGKIRELAGGYGGWIGAWRNFGADDYFDSDDEIKADVLAWRDESPEIVNMWGGQFVHCGPGKWDYRAELFGLEGAVIEAIRNPGQCFAVQDITYAVHDDVLYCRLPSGRFLHYHRPRLSPTEDKLRRGPAVKITFEGWNSNSQKGAVGWWRMETYGGRLFENVVQATAADLQFDGLAGAESEGYAIVMHTHDEGVAEVPLGFGSPEHLTEIMIRRPSWASWWPIRGAGWQHKRYQKD